MKTCPRQSKNNSVEASQPDPKPPTWWAYTQEIPALELWQDYPPVKQPNYYLHRACSICQSAMLTLNPFKNLTCHACQQWITGEEDCANEPNQVNEGRDDEEEFLFQGIPIAGEHKGDSDEDWYNNDEGEEDKEILHQNFTSISINATATEDIAFRVGPTQDGSVIITTPPTITLHLNPYHLLDEAYLLVAQLVALSPNRRNQIRYHLENSDL